TYRKLRTSARLLLAAVADLGSRASSSEAGRRLLLTAHRASPRAGPPGEPAQAIVAELPRGILRRRSVPARNNAAFPAGEGRRWRACPQAHAASTPAQTAGRLGGRASYAAPSTTARRRDASRAGTVEL